MRLLLLNLNYLRYHFFIKTIQKISVMKNECVQGSIAETLTIE